MRKTVIERISGGGDRTYSLNLGRFDSPKKTKMYNHAGFTLAEVLITLGIIGVVAAMTIPTLINNYQKHRVETRLKAFYSNINQALRLAQNEYGELHENIELTGSDYTYEQNRDLLQKYFSPFIKISNYRKCQSTTQYACVDLMDGGFMMFQVRGLGYIDIRFIESGTPENMLDANATRKYFMFRYSNGSVGYEDIFNGEIIKPYDAHWDGTRESLKDKENPYACFKGSSMYAFCTKLIQVSGWKIPDDYPW